MSTEYSRGYSAGYQDGAGVARSSADYAIALKEDAIRGLRRVIDVKNQAINTLGGIASERQEALDEANKLIATLQQSLDEANAKIDATATPKPGEFKVGDKVRSKYNPNLTHIVEMTRVNDEGRQLVKLKNFNGFWFSDKYELAESTPAFRIGDRVKSNKGHFFRIRAISDDGKKVQSEMARLWYSIEEYGIELNRASR